MICMEGYFILICQYVRECVCTDGVLIWGISVLSLKISPALKEYSFTRHRCCMQVSPHCCSIIAKISMLMRNAGMELSFHQDQSDPSQLTRVVF